MAGTFFAGGNMRGCHARALAALSARSFLKLALLGVPFPQNEWGEYVGYQTDHDKTARATSAGPLTSKMMAEALLKSVQSRGGRIESGASLVSILRDEGGVRGVLFRTKEGFLAVSCSRLILATGGPASVYGRRVYPQNQIGATGAALRAGAKANNLCFWQYGLASVGVKWNVSGSYQQAIPEYVDETGAPIAPDMPDRLSRIFLKGYQWPFDARRADGSSLVDRAVKAVSDAGGRAYMDFGRDPVSEFADLSVEARVYLENCGALVKGAYARLVRINPAAADFYRSHGIDLAKDTIEIALCAQHANGGLRVDENWQTTVPGLYAAGECAGAFGAYRPGGAALNETQVGSLRAAGHILGGEIPAPAPLDEDVLARETDWAERRTPDERELDLFQRRMDECAGAVRAVPAMRALKRDVEARLETLTGDALLRDVLWTQKFCLSAMLEQARFSGGAGHMTEGVPPTEGPHAAYAFETDEKGTRAVPVEPIPAGDQWFERVWAKSREAMK
jgi:succinate dehydrogenase/fumarate reductase flavoprotein subunit